jgi:hypothetical protein
MIKTAQLNNFVQATPVSACLFFLRQVPGAPDDNRYVGRKARVYALRNL